ncbi:N-acetyltransferase [Salinibacterium sp. UTAS2018]|uniref:GNAT family N-acetyltransferase n=1 Tax=Salinibacterium sp. UTAS2018 TaxID=2508880 RepID=UPI0010097A28|nr:GNAT family protein [Salinibacterium sp. UTAS2018]QAV71046.1 N-acetyltransferase [Salinibacterium sp. UTAS2018]
MSTVDRRATLESPLRVPVIRTPRVSLRPHRMSDAARWHEIQSSPQVSQYTAWPQRSRRSSLRQLTRRTRQTSIRRVDDVLALAIEFEGELVGEISLQLRSLTASTRCLEVSWIVHPQFQGQGIAYEAMRPLFAYVRANIEALLLVAVVHPENAASVKLAHKLKLHPLPGTADRTVFVGRNGPLAALF